MCVHPRRVEQARSSTSFVDNAIDLSWQNFLSPHFETNLKRVVAYVYFRNAWVSLKHSIDRWKKAFMPKPVSIRPVISIQCRRVKDRQTDRRTQGHSYNRASIATRGHNHYENREPAQHADAKLIRCCHSQYCAFICQWDLPDFD